MYTYIHHFVELVTANIKDLNVHLKLYVFCI